MPKVTQKGLLHVIVGPMGCGKTAELIRLLNREDIAHRRYLLIKPAVDTRSEAKIVSRTGLSLDALPVELSIDILTHVNSMYSVVAIDEAQFFDKDIVFVVTKLLEMGINVILAGLPTDFRRRPFGQMGILLTMAEKITLLSAICMVCGQEASLTQRIIDGVPAPASAPLILIGGEGSYEARCRNHHVYDEI